MKLLKIISGSLLMLALAGSATAQIPGTPRFHKKRGAVVPIPPFFNEGCDNPTPWVDTAAPGGPISAANGWSAIGGKFGLDNGIPLCTYMYSGDPYSSTSVRNTLWKTFTPPVIGASYTVTVVNMISGYNTSSCTGQILDSAGVVLGQKTGITGPNNSTTTHTFTFSVTSTTPLPLMVKFIDSSSSGFAAAAAIAKVTMQQN